VEVLWTGILAVPFGALTSGSEMKAHLAMFFEFRDGRIALQRNYDCFEAW
jgi:ketosteroid isomerase-like protein